MLSPLDPLATTTKIGPKLIKALASMGIFTVGDLLTYYPSRYLDFSKFISISELRAGEVVTVRGIIKTISSRFSFATRKMLAEGIISDSTGSVKVTWFNQGYIAETLKKGDEVLLSGKVDQYKGLQLTNPVYEKVSDENIHTGRLVPVYRLPDTIFPKAFRKLVHDALPAAQHLSDILPPQIRERYAIAPITHAVTELHFPTSLEEVDGSQERLAFEESFIQQLAVQQHKHELKLLAAPSIPTKIEHLKSLITKLPFSLTNGQKKALWAIIQDLQNKHPMNRLLQGDVGSGKTIVALLAALEVTRAGYQIALLAPTEILAEQHFDSIQKQISHFSTTSKERLDAKVALFTRGFHKIHNTPITKKQLLESMKEGTVSLIIGTHALLQESVDFKNLALVIIDEQHRFGVEQRRALSTATSNATDHKDARHEPRWYPHLLSMSATPIPRTAALAVYGDLEISTIDELPKDRLPIKTWVVPEQKRAGAYDFIRKEVQVGRQVFIITPLVEESTKPQSETQGLRMQTKAAKAEFERLQKTVFPQMRLGLVYGSMKSAEKTATMLGFKNKEIDILVATSVIEIGIDIPNATIMMIEGADRFGLAQLHQLRGRVGRGQYQSYCLLFSDVDSSSPRLDLFARTTNGFALAEYDMKARGFGSLFGTNQTGFNFKYGSYLTLRVLEKAKAAAKELTAADPNLAQHPNLQSLVHPLSKELHME